jgi:ubiquinone/menaquinone biosynthesis C-methylase UbiE
VPHLDDGGSELADFTTSTRQTYDRIARRYADRQVQHPSGEEHWLIGLENSFVASLPCGGVVADLGCGPAYDGLRLAGRGLQVVGMDISAGMLGVASEGLNGHVVQADLRALPIASEYIDGIWNVASLLHVPDRDTLAVLTEFRRVMKPSGSLVLVTALGDSSRHEAVPYVSGESRWFVYRNPESLKAQMREAGFLIQIEEEVQGSRHWWTVLASSI